MQFITESIAVIVLPLFSCCDVEWIDASRTISCILSEYVNTYVTHFVTNISFV
jgi:hypothetical protein